MLENISGVENTVDNSDIVTEEANVSEKETQQPQVTEDTKEPVEGQEENNADGKQGGKRKYTGYQKKLWKQNNEISALRAELEAAKAGSPRVDVNPTERPVLDNFKTYEDYVEALVEFKADQKLKQRDAQVQKAQENERQKEQNVKWDEKIEKLDNPDEYFEILEQYKDYDVKKIIIDTVRESDIGPQILLYLGKNPELFDDLNQKGTLSIVREIAKIEAQLLSKPAARLSKSSEPITPLKGSVKSAVKLDNLDTDSYLAQRYPHLTGRR